MGTLFSSSEGVGKHSTAKQVVEAFGEGEYLKGKTAVITGEDRILLKKAPSLCDLQI